MDVDPRPYRGVDSQDRPERLLGSGWSSPSSQSRSSMIGNYSAISSIGFFRPLTGRPMALEPRIATDAPLIPTYIARERQRSMKVLAVVHWSVASPRTGPLKSAHAAHDLGGETLAGPAFQRHASDSCHGHVSCPGPAHSPHAEWLPSKPPHTLTRKGVVLSRDFYRKLLSEMNYSDAD